MDTEQLFNAILDAPTCYPEKERKSREQRKADLVYWYEKYNDVNDLYNLWGMDCTDATNLDEWLDRSIFRKQRHDINAFVYPNGSKFPMDYTVIMRDKRMFEGFAEMVLGYGNKYSPSVAYIVEKQFMLKNGRATDNADFTEFINKYESQMLVFKQVFGCAGETVKVINIKNGLINSDSAQYTPNDFFKSLTCTSGSSWIVQEYIEQHDDMKKMNATSVNTLRIVTYNTGDSVTIFPTIMMRYGVPGALVDNSSLGVGVDINGVVMESAYNLKQKQITKCHAAGMSIPFFKEALELVRHLHSNIPEIFTVGWDICITPNGPHVIEGNDGWDMALYQSIKGCRMRPMWNEMVAKHKAYYNK